MVSLSAIQITLGDGMFSGIKLTTVSWIVGLFMMVTTIIILVSATVVQHNINFIGSTWQIYQADRSEKARLETALRAEIGYSAMIHEFKNYVLRHKAIYKQSVDFHLGSAKGIVNQYKGLEIDQAERIALDDLLGVLANYTAAVDKAEVMISQGHSTVEIDNAVKVDDEPALRALRTLRSEVFLKGGTINKSRLAADLRAALGYGGMIHLYKNFILRHENNADSIYNQEMLVEINQHIQSSLDVVDQYQRLGATNAETIVLEDIKKTIFHYQTRLQEISQLAQQNLSAEEIDSKVQVDDSLAIRGLEILDREIYRQLNVRAQQVGDTIEFVNTAIKVGKWVSIVMVLIVMAMILWLLRFTVINPVTQLIGSMVKLADNQLDVEIPGYQQHNEIGQMMHSVSVFKKNMIAHHEAEQKLALNNKLMELKLDEITKLRRLADEHSRKSLSLAEGMAEARLSTEKMMHQLREDEKLVSTILNAVQDGIITIDSYGIIETFNLGAEQIFGYKSIEVVNKNISKLMPEPLSSEHDSYLQRYRSGQSNRDQTVPLETVALRKNGESFPVEITLNPIDIDNKMKIMGVIRDITERKDQQEKIRLLAMTDPLTGLANRHKYNESLDKAVKQALRFNTQFALLFIDLDKFKPVNDTYGHPVGDALLQHVATELVASCRDVDLVARLGGDEFAILAIGINEQKEVSVLAERIIDALSNSVTIGSHTIQIGASIGISYFPQDSSEIEGLSRMADEALYIAKQEGRNTYRYYSELKSQK